MPKKKKKTPPINFIISLEVYLFDLMVSIGQSDKQLAKSLEIEDNRMTEADYEICKYGNSTSPARAVMFSTNASLLRMRKLPTGASGFGTMAHEIFHIVAFVMHRVGMKLKILVSDEAYAYLTGYITEKIYDELNKYY